ncbi:GNAT family N-acetyltransferase [Streptomyces sp. NPDC002431]
MSARAGGNQLPHTGRAARIAAVAIYLETARMTLRRFTGADVEALAALHGHPDVMRWTDDGRPVPRDVGVMEKAGLSLIRTFFEEWPEPIEGAEHGDVEYAVTRETWSRRHGGQQRPEQHIHKS